MWSVLSRTPGEAPGSHSLEDQPHIPEHQLSLSPEPWEAPPVKEALKSEFRPVSRTYLSSLKNKLSSGAWRRSCQPGVSPGPETQVRDSDWGMGSRTSWPSISSSFSLLSLFFLLFKTGSYSVAQMGLKLSTSVSPELGSQGRSNSP